MNIVELSTGKVFDIDISSVKKEDYKSLYKSRYYFDWKQEALFEVYKLTVIGSTDILGLISLERFPDEWRIHIRLLTLSRENVGKDKRFERIAGNLLAFAAKIAVREYGVLACVSLRPKTQIAKNYMNKYKMNITGMTLSLEVPEILNLINEYE